jgi:hypothetical protein
MIEKHGFEAFGKVANFEFWPKICGLGFGA